MKKIVFLLSCCFLIGTSCSVAAGLYPDKVPKTEIVQDLNNYTVFQPEVIIHFVAPVATLDVLILQNDYLFEITAIDVPGTDVTVYRYVKPDLRNERFRARYSYNSPFLAEDPWKDCIKQCMRYA